MKFVQLLTGVIKCQECGAPAEWGQLENNDGYIRKGYIVCDEHLQRIIQLEELAE